MSEQLKSLGEDRSAFMQRIHAALGRSATQKPAKPPPDVDDALTRIESSEADLLARFESRARAVGMQVHRAGKKSAAAAILEVLRAHQAQRIGVGAGVVGAQLALAEQLANAGVEITDIQAVGSLERQYQLDAGITDVNGAIAESGTLVCCSGPSATRGLSLVPPVHVALVRRSDVLEDLTDFYRRQRGLPPGELPSSIAFITGPSKTADIEGELITGVHGPGHVHIILIEDL